MSKYRNNLPQLEGGLFLTEGGFETHAYFDLGLDLPEFAAFPLIYDDEGRGHLAAFTRRHMSIAQEKNLGFILETPTWRANPDHGAKLGFDRQRLDQANRDAVAFAKELRDEFETPEMRIVVSGNIGPRHDGYAPERLMTPQEAQAYHADQVNSFAAAGVDQISTLTMTHLGEAVGITWAAQEAGVPVVMSFTTETDGRLPSGQALGDAIIECDEMTGNGPAYYMVNCAHPTHFEDAIRTDEPWIHRLKGIRANASKMSHEELDNSTELDSGDPLELGIQYREIRDMLPHITVLGGCCGTDERHVGHICSACVH